ncbi:type II toxin-antitoxin system prevent-host-death family antitoxin [Pediococcus ethanolidurans]|uniref:Antitoxin n=1 Tax=Pediococcus ethanolidurans TaxID=319653 RepID=A0A0R2JWK5_9LACO|nr:type II toxin-antitoxin system prevent-host-death family antitoxin [Pediococcus ethanolidurans]KRN81502.1 hypothetical protein IV87_GL001140 [Pediococcus ethanolidurans]MDV7719563.1 type II toxin-antitoxin system prevent-host-death family antitoxin [Pediococcus ethanolidurans]GEN95866.1 hypothetical protein PET01_19160 [Pediococcus ethanolidurans]SER86500.1 prevent-host-death family protein [Pediococcus ethanolidurans]
MINIKPVSELRNYNKVLDEVKPDEPVILTKNGYGKYAVVSLDEYEKFQDGLKLLEELKVAEKGSFYNIEDVRRKLLDK